MINEETSTWAFDQCGIAGDKRGFKGPHIKAISQANHKVVFPHITPKDEWFSLFVDVCAIVIERLNMMLRQTANSKNETFAICLQLCVRYSENIFICGE